jgi:hypothetical protein
MTHFSRIFPNDFDALLRVAVFAKFRIPKANLNSVEEMNEFAHKLAL